MEPIIEDTDGTSAAVKPSRTAPSSCARSTSRVTTSLRSARSRSAAAVAGAARMTVVDNALSPARSSIVPSR
jgi:hypothetical protein